MNKITKGTKKLKNKKINKEKIWKMFKNDINNNEDEEKKNGIIICRK